MAEWKATQLFLIIAVVLILGGSFYWFQVRPERKRAECLRDAQEAYLQTWNEWDKDKDGRLLTSDADKLGEIKYDNIDRCIKIWK